eukprot:GFKZ01006216.1.p1 GENE.GFKZ01006216.1~~GFKZ01006216.1.p1  ORF type:complete len:198 (+),score=6.78 GFKZ01006216.1:354-947(+)
MVAMWLPPPTALLSPHDINPRSTILSQPFHHHQQPFVISSDYSPELPHRRTLYASPAPASPLPKPRHLVTKPSSITKVNSPSRVPSKKLFRCPYPDCNQTSSNKGNLSKHIATRHEHRKDFECPFKGCKRRFAKKYNMQRHLSASGVHRQAKLPSSNSHVPTGASSDRRNPQWSSTELDLANFLATKCQQNHVLRAL